jgi:hypothetical protein
MRIMSAINDPRYHFMFSNNTIHDTIMETIAHIFRIPGDDRPISTFQLAGIPSEVVNSVASILCRMAFELALWSHGAVHMLVVCEEAHRYVPADREVGFYPTVQAISRIAKEGRKYGVSLGVITQRPGELDQTILSQCSTLFAMRLSNERDQEIIKSAIPNSSISTTSFLSSIGNGEAIAFGEAISVPMRMKFARVEQRYLPKANGVVDKGSEETPDTVDLRTVVARMRSVTGPDISSFQQSYSASDVTPALDGTDAADDMADSFPPATPAEVDRWRRDMRTADAPAGGETARPAAPPALEPYRPEMLPGAAVRERTPPPRDRFADIRRERSEDGSPNAPASAGFAARPNPFLRREGSLRESLLKKPLGSLYEKD